MAQVTVENNAKLEQLLLSHPDMEKKIRKIIRQVIRGAQSGMQRQASSLSTKHAYQAISSAVYKKVLGGNLNIISKNRRAGNRAPLPPESPRKKSHDRGGNRLPRSQRTEDLLTYQGADRGFILRFLEYGTVNRESRYGNRGSIAARNWFGDMSHRELQHAAEQFELLLDELIEKEFNQ
jgi:hypothetical protein